MPWKVRSEVDKPIRFMAHILKGDTTTVLCAECAISRKTVNAIDKR